MSMYPTRSRAAYPPPRFDFLFFDVETLFFLTSKWNEKSMKNGPKINQKSIKNGPKIDQKSSKIEVWSAPGQVWRPLGPSWAIQRIFEGILDRLGGVMEASWAGKVANMAPTWPQVGAQNGGKIRLGPSWRRLGSLLEASCSRFYAFLMNFCCMP